MKWLLFYLLILLCYSCEIPDIKISISYPDDHWEVTSPKDFGIDEGKMNNALSYLKSKSYDDGNEEVLIVSHGKIIFQGDSITKKHNIYSCSKAFTSTVLGLLIDQGKLTLDSKASSFDESLDSLYPEVSFKHFATMTSGYSGKGRSRWNDENSDWSYTPYEPEAPHFAPGSHYEYWDEAQMTYGKVLTKILGETMQSYLQRELTDKINMGNWEWYPEQETDGIPINNGCTNVTLNAMQLARFGHLYLNRGNWNGEQLLSKTWCEGATASQVSASIPVYNGDRSNVKGSGSYGYNWWVNSTDGLSKMPDAPLGTAYMSGLNHNICCIVPEWNMVIIRMGDDKNPPEGKHIVWNEFLKRMGESID